jgi:hypothetical protein
MIKLTEDEKSLLIQFRGTPTFKLLQKIHEQKVKAYSLLALKSRDIIKVAEYDGAVMSSHALIRLIEQAGEKNDDTTVQG